MAQRFLSDNPLRHVLGDWAVSGILTLQSGAPFTLNTQVNSTSAFSAGHKSRL